MTRAVLLALALWLAPLRVLAGEPVAPGAPSGENRNAQAGEPGCAPSAVAAAPGTGFGFEVTARGDTPPSGSSGAPVLLDVRLTRPGDPEGAPPLGWVAAAWPGAPARVSWEFAYDWEIVPGIWTMRVFQDGTPVASACFEVSRLPAGTTARTEQASTNASATPSTSSGSGGSAPRPARETAPAPAPAAPPAPTPTPPPTAPAPTPAPAPPPARETAPAPVQRPKPPNKAAAKPVPAPADTAPGGTLHVLVSGVYSEEARAQWMAALLSGKGLKACVREEQGKSRRLWAVVTGWAATPGEARALRDRQAATAGETVVRSMAAGELARGLRCR